MEVQYYYLSSPGGREDNEDAVGFWRPSTDEEWQTRGAVMILADGVGGHGDGDLASRLAVNTALKTFTAAALDAPPAELVREMAEAANVAVLEAGIDAARVSRHSNRMATTFTASLVRGDKAYVAHVGDCRLYHFRGQQINRITTDHSYAGIQVKLRLIGVDQAAANSGRFSLTRALGQNSMLQVDTHVIAIQSGDFLVQCSDGLYSCMTERELHAIVTRWPEQSPAELRDLCERRKADDNFTAQVLQMITVDMPVPDSQAPVAAR
ncbi:MAG: serine/threonine-protein phosphatase, partial [Phycisphaerae bacterium]|nr:serine/threonine-protein phosphatase [Phycisphaerae bacterium]